MGEKRLGLGGYPMQFVQESDTHCSDPIVDFSNKTSCRVYVDIPATILQCQYPVRHQQACRSHSSAALPPIPHVPC